MGKCVLPTTGAKRHPGRGFFDQSGTPPFFDAVSGRNHTDT